MPTCLQCQVENSADRRFCSACGAALPISCDHCGFQNQGDARFCGGCGTQLARHETADNKPRLSQAPESAPPAEERRQVTVFFCDLSNFTNLSTQLDPEEIRDLVAEVFENIDSTLVDFGGTVNRHMGDGVMALFGAPVAHEDDPLRALHAACKIHDVMGSLSKRLGRSLKVHIGIASGHVLAAGIGSSKFSEYTVLGESVNLASRLLDQAAADQTVISSEVYNAVRSHVECEPLGSLSLKGLTKPVSAWRALRMKEVAEQTAVPKIVGRKPEFQQFNSLLDLVLEGGPGQIMILKGDPGIGKSRLAAEFMAIAEHRGFACHKAHNFNFGVTKGQDTIRVLFRSLAGITASCSEAVEERRAAVARFEKGFIEEEQYPHLYDLLDIPQPPEMHDIYDAMDNLARNVGKQLVLTTAIKKLSERKKLFLLVEDVHWAGPVTLAYLNAICKVVSECSAILVVTTRSTDAPRFPTPSSTTIELGPLLYEEAVDFAGQQWEPKNSFVTECIRRAAGNPFFLEQLLLNAEDTLGSAVPASVHSLMLARMDRLPQRDKSALQAASIIGQRFEFKTLQHLIDDSEYYCSSLISNGLIRQEEDTLAFAHSLIQEAVYESLLKSRARELHLKAAAWFKKRDAVVYAQHLERAKDELAAAAYLDAARQQFRSFHFIEARNLAEHGLSICKSADTSYELATFLGNIRLHLRDRGEAIEAFEQALALAQSDQQKCCAMIGIAEGMRDTGAHARALDVLETAESLADIAGLDEELAQICYQRGNLHFPLGEVDICLAEHARSLQFARRANSPKSEAKALSGLGDAEYARGRMVTAHHHFKNCLEICERQGLSRIELENRPLLGLTSFYQNDLTSSLDDCAAGISAARKAQHQRAEMVARLAAAPIHLERMDLEETREHCELTLPLAKRAEAHGFEVECLLFLAKVSSLEGHGKKAESYAKAAVEQSMETSSTFTGPWSLGTLAVVAGSRTERQEALRRGEDLLTQNACVSHNYLWFYRDAMEASLKEKNWDAAEYYASRLEEYIAAEPLPWSEFYIAWGRALSNFGRGDHSIELLEKMDRLRHFSGSSCLNVASLSLSHALVD